MVQPCNSGTQEHSAPDGYADFSLMIIMIRDNREHLGTAGSPSPAAGDMLARLFPGARRGHFLPVPRTVSIMQYGRAIANEHRGSPKAKQGWPYAVPGGPLFLVSYEF
jgi:hypothetical protein